MEQSSKMGWKKYLLIGSLGVNLLVAFAVGGAFMKTGKPKSNKDGVFLQGAMLQALPKERKKSLHDGFRKSREGRKDRGSFGDLRKELKDVIVVVPFDADALGAVLKKQRDIRAGYSEAGDAALVAVISEMTNEERAAFAKNIKFRKFKHKKK